MNVKYKQLNKCWVKFKQYFPIKGQKLEKINLILINFLILKVYSEEINEISGLFEISAHLPVIESFSFCDQLRKRSRGKASAQLEFSGWQLIDEDPFWEPSTEEEVEKINF